MKVTNLLSVALALVVTATCGLAQAEIVSGIEVQATKSTGSGTEANQGPPLSHIMATIEPPPGATVIDFDDIDVPCIWLEISGPITNEYADQGVTFSGPNDTDGAGVINECGSFPVSGYSAPNFLATNSGGTYSGGGTPDGPETITFATPVTHVQIDGGAAAITMECYSGDTLVGSASIAQAEPMETLSVTGANITHCVLSWEQPIAVFDNLAFVAGEPEPPMPVPSLGTLATFVLVLLILVSFTRIQRKRVQS